MEFLTWNQVLRHRFARHSLIDPAPATHIVQVVKRVGGIHAQVMGAAELSISARIPAATQADVRAELWERRRLIKTYGPRGTLHLLAADELPLWMAALRARIDSPQTHWYASTGWSSRQAQAVVQAISDALDGRCLTREELAQDVVARVGRWAEKPLASMWGDPASAWAAYTGKLCFGPARGSRVTFVRADQWVGRWNEVDPSEALVEICRRYLAAFGPARPQDFAEWFGLQPEHARTVFEALGDELQAVNLEGHHAWRLASDARDLIALGQPSLRLVPQYDSYIMGCRERDRYLPEKARARIATHARGRFEGPAAMSWMLVDGVVAGTWERRKQGKRIEMQVEPLIRLTTALRRQLEAEAERIARFLGTDGDLEVVKSL